MMTNPVLNCVELFCFQQTSGKILNPFVEVGMFSNLDVVYFSQKSPQSKLGNVADIGGADNRNMNGGYQ